MIYVGNNTFLHCTGSSFVYNSDPATSYDQATSTERNNGAIQTLSADNVFVNTSHSRYLFTAENTSFSVIRPLARTGLVLTEQATLRAFIPDIVIEKSATTPHMSTVARGEDITYSITLTNKGTSTYSNLVIRDAISALCSYKADTINNSGLVAGRDVTWSGINLAPSASITLSYTVTVNNDATIGGIIESYSATVNCVLTNKIYHTIGGFSASDYSDLTSAATALIGSNYDGDTSDGLKVAIDLYYNAFGYYFVNSSTTATNIDNSLIYSNRENNTIDTTSGYYPLVNPNFYGGLLIKNGLVTDNLRIRNNKPSYFETGDIIIETDNHSGVVKKLYIYISESEIIGLDGDNNVAVIYSTTDAVESFLSQMIGYHRYVVLRPALAYDPS
ncbi:MAG: DUF11 domain-containing protein [Bacilli bacterium]|nr:DUF11 domain-containing protein [Bacilli bacterium]